MTIGERLKMIRKKENLLLKEVADICEITVQTLSRYENDQRTPDNDVIKVFVKRFNVSSDWLLFGEAPIYRTNLDRDLKESFIELSTLLNTKEFSETKVPEKYDFVIQQITEDIPDNYLLLLKYMLKYPLIRKSIFQFFLLVLKPIIDKNTEISENEE